MESSLNVLCNFCMKNNYYIEKKTKTEHYFKLLIGYHSNPGCGYLIPWSCYCPLHFTGVSYPLTSHSVNVQQDKHDNNPGTNFDQQHVNRTIQETPDNGQEPIKPVITALRNKTVVYCNSSFRHQLQGHQIIVSVFPECPKPFRPVWQK